MAELLLDLRKSGLYPGYLCTAECNSEVQEKVPSLDMDLSRASCTHTCCELLSDQGVGENFVKFVEQSLHSALKRVRIGQACSLGAWERAKLLGSRMHV